MRNKRGMVRVLEKKMLENLLRKAYLNTAMLATTAAFHLSGCGDTIINNFYGADAKEHETRIAPDITQNYLDSSIVAEVTKVETRAVSEIIQNNLDSSRIADVTQPKPFCVGDLEDNILESETKKYLFKNKTYEITLSYVDFERSSFTINGKNTKFLKIGDSYTLHDGAILCLEDIQYQPYAGGVHATTFTFSGGTLAGDVITPDVNFNPDTISSEDVAVSTDSAIPEDVQMADGITSTEDALSLEEIIIPDANAAEDLVASTDVQMPKDTSLTVCPTFEPIAKQKVMVGETITIPIKINNKKNEQLNYVGAAWSCGSDLHFDEQKFMVSYTAECQPKNQECDATIYLDSNNKKCYNKIDIEFEISNPPVSCFQEKGFGSFIQDFDATEDNGLIVRRDQEIQKLDQYGKEKWSKKIKIDFNENVYGGKIKQTTDKGYVFCSFFTGLYSKPAPQNSGVVIKTDAQGNLVWKTYFNDKHLWASEKSGPPTEICTITELANSQYLLIGPHKVSRLTEKGEMVWTKDGSVGEEIIWTSDVTKEGEALLGIVTFESYKQKGVATIKKLDSQGNKFWEKSYYGVLEGGMLPKSSLLATNDGGALVVLNKDYYNAKDLLLNGSIVKLSGDGNKIDWKKEIDPGINIYGISKSKKDYVLTKSPPPTVDGGFFIQKIKSPWSYSLWEKDLKDLLLWQQIGVPASAPKVMKDGGYVVYIQHQENNFNLLGSGLHKLDRCGDPCK